MHGMADQHEHRAMETNQGLVAPNETSTNELQTEPMPNVVANKLLTGRKGRIVAQKSKSKLKSNPDPEGGSRQLHHL